MRLFLKYILNPFKFYKQIRVVTTFNSEGNPTYSIWRGHKQYDCTYGNPAYNFHTKKHDKPKEPCIRAWEDRLPVSTSCEETLMFCVTHATESWKLIEARNRKRAQKNSVQFLPNV